MADITDATPDAAEKTESKPTPRDIPPRRDPAPERDRTPRFEGEFDPDRAARLVANLRAELDQRESELKALREKAAVPDDLTSRLAALEERAKKAEREVAVARLIADLNLPKDAADLLSGDDPEALTAQAKRLAELLSAETPPKRGTTAPKPDLRPGAGTSSEDNPDVSKIADAIWRTP